MVPLHHQASELYRRLGLMDRVSGKLGHIGHSLDDTCIFISFASDFIQNLITKRKQIEAIKFIYEFGLVDKFPPFPLLRAHLQDAKRAHKKATKEADSRQSKDEAFDKEIAAVKAVISCVKDHKIECKYTSKNLGKRINQLKALKRSREKEIEGGKDCTRTAPQAQQQHHNKKKRLRADPAANSNPK
ncbi:FRIGIDA-like protein 4a [Vitis vinifera]|uniref:FRIGIDA-like protein n=1 Tax=Vitis vinifera TaxID=29760 RepID=A0A438KA21_VITVI|nr:FRIGIDA-like protein 4a [Vitis vinifera]